MILFLGTKPGKTSSQVLSDIPCPYCQINNTLTATSHSTYFHVFWISLFKISNFTEIRCSHCKKVYYEKEFTPAMQQQLKEQTKLPK
ncbi:hypothetical protein SAMN04487911_11469 [Arenibacter nanhaiticus]|uniref:Zinc-ribbon 15 domain-containing protein n=1 Tax=Arenibacter nanhaiticus TaxID=558155 RepID=A0A1M6HM07_9FLAO|nr:zinc-ribbon domain-containing protein [Arenibacter nanhaiticus]SHJ23180.1 hypothetical protein SAMN04487911_11469 [Arenibacter nanhaiticus]